ncbi:hypothetical protein VNI00_007017 [Paramarasmius palmivorus]|uniref:F-box domain-containing protein n=1 Tax=Paramarasmius palmivorus TaxID=297713 RepID=A0AAW0D4G6_9AGAR
MAKQSSKRRKYSSESNTRPARKKPAPSKAKASGPEENATTMIVHDTQVNTTAKGKKKSRVPARKKAKMQSDAQKLVIVDKNASRIRGLLARFMKEAPLDIMLEIFALLQPKDLLNLIRTSKDVRALLLSKTTAQIWRTVMKETCLPPMPDDLCEPEYASLAFDSYCDVCESGPCENVSWECRIRCHKRCAEESFIAYSNLRNVPTWSEGIEEMDKQGVIKLVPRVITSNFEHRRISSSYFVPSILDNYRLEFLEVKDDPEKLAEWKEDKKEEYEELTKHDLECRKWHLRKQEQRKTELEDLRKIRVDTIIRKLEALGWDKKDLARRPQITHHSVINQPKELTEKEWERIGPTIIGIVQRENVRTKEDRERIQEYAGRYQRFGEVYAAHLRDHGDPAIPPLGDVVVAAKSVESLIWDTPWKEQVSEGALAQALRTDLPNLTREWTAVVRKKLRSRIAKNQSQATPNTAIFRCLVCQELLWIPRLYSHRCLSAHKRPTAWQWYYNPFKILSWRLWSSRLLTLHRAGTANAQKMLQLCGLDTTRASLAEDLDNMDVVFECLDCKSGPARHFMRWTSVLKHSKGHQLSVTSYDDVVRSLVMEYFNSCYPRKGSGGKYWRCSLCEDSRPYEDIKEHIRETHALADEDIKPEHWYADRNMTFAHLDPGPFRYVP